MLNSPPQSDAFLKGNVNFKMWVLLDRCWVLFCNQNCSKSHVFLFVSLLRGLGVRRNWSVKKTGVQLTLVGIRSSFPTDVIVPCVDDHFLPLVFRNFKIIPMWEPDSQQSVQDISWIAPIYLSPVFDMMVHTDCQKGKWAQSTIFKICHLLQMF